MTKQIPLAYQIMETNPSKIFSLKITRTWDDKKLTPDESADILCQLDITGLRIKANAAYYNDEAPGALPGPTESLWEYEVLELFLLGENGHYLEIEFGPHGHYLILMLEGIRNRKTMPSLISMTYEAQIAGKNWNAFAQLPQAILPPNITRVNAYAMHGRGKDRRYLAAYPVPGLFPDFHQPHLFHPISELYAQSSSPLSNKNNSGISNR